MSKHVYSTDQLRTMDIDHLYKRLLLLDNNLAWRLAAELFIAAFGIKHTDRSVSELAYIAKQLWNGTDADSMSLMSMTPAGMNLLRIDSVRRNVNRLAQVPLNNYVTANPQEIIAGIKSGNPLSRLMPPLTRLENSTDLVEFLLDNMKSIMPPQKGTQTAVHIISRLITAMTTAVLLCALAGYLAPTSMTIYPFMSSIMFLAIATSLFVAAGFDLPASRSASALALYISFTDEFMDDEKQYDDPAIVDKGW
ncbi:hypothetical protein KDL44_13625 [bacterium]|nr:hypothetical protein [bacterium]